VNQNYISYQVQMHTMYIAKTGVSFRHLLRHRNSASADTFKCENDTFMCENDTPFILLSVGNDTLSVFLILLSVF
jgi:hypothetical protein